MYFSRLYTALILKHTTIYTINSNPVVGFQGGKPEKKSLKLLGPGQNGSSNCQFEIDFTYSTKIDRKVFQKELELQKKNNPIYFKSPSSSTIMF